MRVWVVSPNVKNDDNATAWLDAIRRNNCVYMGWGPGESRKGNAFYDKVELGNVILVAQGANKNKKLHFAGFVDSDVKEVTPAEDGVPEHAYSRELRSMVGEGGLAELTLDFIGAAFGDSRQPGAIYELHPDKNHKDREIVEKVTDVLEKAAKMNELKAQTEKWISLLVSSKNLILTGAPGTGKTYLAKQIAQKLVFGDGWVLKDEQKFTDEERHLFSQRVGFVQFHPSYDYTDFVEGLRPTKPEASCNVGFERKDGVFKEFCKRTLQYPQNGFDDAWNYFVQTCKMSPLLLETPTQNRKFTARVNANESFSCKSNDAESDQEQSVTKEDVRTWINNGTANWPSYTPPLAKYFKERFLSGPFVFIIDEINRGEISKIFGELFFSVDPGYRGEKGKVQTQYANLIEDDDAFKDGFFVPENVYIIGTMNDIDRSVESLDFAMRRRFVFKEITAAESAVSMNLPEKVKSRMAALNAAISNPEIGGLNSSYHIGAAYFLRDGKPTDEFAELWNLRLEPLLKEYLRGTPNADDNIGKLKAAFELIPST